MSVVGIGVTSEELKNAVQKAAPTFENSDFVPAENTKSEIVSQWTGGIVTRNEPATYSFSFMEGMDDSKYWSMSWEGPSQDSHAFIEIEKAAKVKIRTKF